MKDTSIMCNNELEITIKGEAELKFWKHDLKFKAAIALLETIDRKDFLEAGMLEEFDQFISKVRKTVSAVNRG